MAWELYSRSNYNLVKVEVENVDREERERRINYIWYDFQDNQSTLPKLVKKKNIQELLESLVEFIEELNIGGTELEDNLGISEAEIHRIKNRLDCRVYRWKNRGNRNRLYDLPNTYPIITDEDYAKLGHALIRYGFMKIHGVDFKGNYINPNYYLVRAPGLRAVVRADDELMASEYYNALARQVEGHLAADVTPVPREELENVLASIEEEGRATSLETNYYLRSLKPGIVLLDELQ